LTNPPQVLDGGRHLFCVAFEDQLLDAELVFHRFHQLPLVAPAVTRVLG
jgi:hypothetical protein